MSSAAAQDLVRNPPKPEAEVYIVQPADGATVSSPVRVVFGLKGMGVAPAGVEREGTGHHHLLIDTCLPDLDRPIPADDKHRHFGGGQTETLLELAPGKHTLTLLLADHRHVPHDPAVYSKTIEITVE
ncbi:MAG: DUF4399 domain-containing protein [Pseudomonadota bacterium]